MGKFSYQKESTIEKSGLQHLPFGSRKVVFFAPDGIFSVSGEGVETKFCDQVLRAYEASGYVVERFVSPNYRQIQKHKKEEIPSFRKSHLSLSAAWTLVYLLREIIHFRVRKSRILREAWLQGRTHRFRKVLKRLKPSLVLGIGLGPAEIIASKQLGVSCAEFQHGEIDSDTLNSYFPKVWPDYFLHWFREDASMLSNFGTQPIFIGLPHIAESRVESSRGSSGNVLVLLQYGLSDSVDPIGCCHFSVAQEVKNCTSFSKVTFRVHPALNLRKQKVAIRSLRQVFPNADFRLAQDSELRDELAAADVTISYSSASWIDSLAAGCHTVITSESLYQSAKDRLPALVGTLCRTVDEFRDKPDVASTKARESISSLRISDEKLLTNIKRIEMSMRNDGEFSH